MTNSEDYTVEMYKNMIRTMASDMRFVGIVSIILGALNSIMIVTAIIGVPVIFAGIRLRESAMHFQTFAEGDDQTALKHAHERLSRSMHITKVLMIIYIVFSALSLIGFLLVMLFMGSQIMQMNNI